MNFIDPTVTNIAVINNDQRVLAHPQPKNRIAYKKGATVLVAVRQKLKTLALIRFPKSKYSPQGL